MADTLKISLACNVLFAITIITVATTLSIYWPRNKDNEASLPVTCPSISANTLLKVTVDNPVTLMLSTEKYIEDPNYEKMIIKGLQLVDEPNTLSNTVDVRWKDYNNYWYLEVSPIATTDYSCPEPTTINSASTLSDNENVETVSSCNEYNFRLNIYNNLSTETTIHFHGLMPPSNQDGVPFVTNPNIHPYSTQYYRFNQFTYAGFFWMHSHTGFGEALGIKSAIVFQHSDKYLSANGINKTEDIIAVVEESFVYPHCAYSRFWYTDECSNIETSKYGNLMLFINGNETSIEHFPHKTTSQVRIRFLNAGSEAAWKITGTLSKSYGGQFPGMKILAMDGNDVLMSSEKNDLEETFILGLANRMDVLVQINHTSDIVITAIQMMHRDSVRFPAYRHIIIHGSESLKFNHYINPSSLRNVGAVIVPIYSGFSVLSNYTAAHPLVERKITKSFTIINRGGDQFGGFPLSIYNGANTSTILNEENNLYPVHNYTQLNELKFQLPPYKVYKHEVTGQIISTRRPCSNCNSNIVMNSSGLRPIPLRNSDNTYDISYYPDESGDYKNQCCWEWCDVPEDECQYYNLIDVTDYYINDHYIPIAWGDRVEILFINNASFERKEGHPMHIHGHFFAVTGLYNISGSQFVNIHNFNISGPLLDTIWVNYGNAVTVQFDAFNPGEWLLHCHNDFHIENGMMTTIRYTKPQYWNSSYSFIGGSTPYPKQQCSMGGCSTNSPTYEPTAQPTLAPTSNPTFSPTTFPSSEPSVSPSCQPSVEPTSSIPTNLPSSSPSVNPSPYPTPHPSDEPTMRPSANPSIYPTAYPSGEPTDIPTVLPSTTPTTIPTSVPIQSTTTSFTNNPSNYSSVEPLSFQIPELKLRRS